MFKNYYYVHTGHRIGLDRFRRASAIVKALDNIEITVLTSDFRIGCEAKEYGITKAVGVDVVRNIPQIAEYGDAIIFDSNEFNEPLLNDMCDFFSPFIRISENKDDKALKNELLLNAFEQKSAILDPIYFEQKEKTIKRAFFFGDDDYEKDLQKNSALFNGLEFDLLDGFYYFMGYANEMSDTFGKIYDNEDYDEVITQSEVLVTCSPQAVLQNLASGGKPVYIQREDYESEYLDLFSDLNIPILKEFDKEQLILTLSNIDRNVYQKVNNRLNDVVNILNKAIVKQK
ncbi:MAG: hypothetical protein GQ570_07810 [Helicobacteraceae bacterium]|nr:hypothetical protein [Helicobacteraceae bacterium]